MDDLTMEEIVRYNGLCIVGYDCEDCPAKDTCKPDKFPFAEADEE